MPQSDTKPPILSTALVFIACALVALIVVLLALYTQLPIWLSILIGALVAGPIVLLSLRLHPNYTPPDGASKRFWPTRVELWGLLGLFTFFASALAPLFVFIPLFLLVPSGDGWGLVVVRMSLVILSIWGYLCWIKLACKTFPEFFRGKLPDEILDAFKEEGPKDEPVSAMAAIQQNWQLPIIAAVAFCVLFGVVNFDNRWLDIDAGPRRFRKITRVLVWCRGNPNTVGSSSLLVGAGALLMFGHRIRRAHVRGKQRLVNEPACNNAVNRSGESGGLPMENQSSPPGYG